MTSHEPFFAGWMRETDKCKACTPMQCFIGLVTTTDTAVVDTGAESGCIGESAMRRLEEKLKNLGLWVKDMQGRATNTNGIGGAAEVVRRCIIPVGLGGTNGMLRLTVVKGEVPLVLPIRLMAMLGAVINLPKGKIDWTWGLPRRQSTLERLESGHVTVSIMEYGADGWHAPAGTEHYVPSDWQPPSKRLCEPLSQAAECSGAGRVTLSSQINLYDTDRGGVSSRDLTEGVSRSTSARFPHGAHFTGCREHTNTSWVGLETAVPPQADQNVAESSTDCRGREEKNKPCEAMAGKKNKYEEEAVRQREAGKEIEDIMATHCAAGGCMQNEVLAQVPPEVQVLLSHPLPLCPHRTNLQAGQAEVSHVNDSQVRSQAFGGYTGRGIGICMSTVRHPEVTSAIHALARRRKGWESRGGYLAAALIESIMLPVHTDRNEGEWVWTISFGDFSGGRLWISYHSLSLEECDVPPGPCAKENLKGRFVSTKMRWTLFNSALPHGVEDR
eukprot:4937144-Amphidinium_carterae.2